MLFGTHDAPYNVFFDLDRPDTACNIFSAIITLQFQPPQSLETIPTIITLSRITPATQRITLFAESRYQNCGICRNGSISDIDYCGYCVAIFTDTNIGLYAAHTP